MWKKQRKSSDYTLHSRHRLFDIFWFVASGAGAVEYIICHAEISIVFVEETKISEVVNFFAPFSDSRASFVDDLNYDL